MDSCKKADGEDDAGADGEEGIGSFIFIQLDYEEIRLPIRFNLKWLIDRNLNDRQEERRNG